jgi:hypothetical protein
MRFRIPGMVNSPPAVKENAPQDVETPIPDSKEDPGSERVNAGGSDSERPSTEYQHGDLAIRAMTQMWERKHLIAAYIL